MPGRINFLPLQLEDTYASSAGPVGYSYPPSAGPAIGISDILRTLRRDWWFPVFGCLIGLTLAVSYIVFVPTSSLYKSSARILLDRSVNRYLQTKKIVDEPTFDDGEIGSQIYILSSESIVVPVVRSMNLAHDSEFVGPAAGAQILWINKLIKIVKQSIGWHDDATIDPTTDPDAALERTAVETFLKRLSITREDVANVINVAFVSEDPNKAARIANAIVDTYIATTLEVKFKPTKIANQWFQDRLIELKAQTTEAARALLNYKLANNLVDLALTGGGISVGIVDTGKGLLNSEQLSGVNTQLTNARIAVAEAKARLDRIQQMTSEGITSATVTDALKNRPRAGAINLNLNDGEISSLRSQYLDLAKQATELESHAPPGHMAVVKLHKRMDELRTSIRDEEQRIAYSQYQSAKTRESELAATVAKLVEEARRSSQAQVRMRELESSADTLRDLYNSFLQKFGEVNTNLTQSITVEGDARIITKAAPPLSKSFPKKAAAVFAGSIMLGLFLGAGAAIAREWTADVFRTPKAVEQVTDIDCLTLPIVKANRERTASFQGSTKSMLIEEFVLDAPYSHFTETLRHVKALINTAQRLHDAKVIGVVSSVTNEGKTTIAANLAALMIASSGARTLLIDGDLHRRLLTAKLAPDAPEGLIEALADPSRLATLVFKRQGSGLDILPCVLSTRIPNAAELLGSPPMEQVLAAAREAYDYIIIEIAPIMSVVDLQMIERFIDRFIFVVEWGQTKRRLVLEALSEAQIIRERVIGIVLNKVDRRALRSIEAYKGDRYSDYYEADS
jgi:polysaccharide biosynthesis transport protein